jgi:opacity protein-like surface antigen
MKVVKLAVLALALVAGAAHAQFKGYGTFEYSDETNRETKKDSIKGAFVIGGKNAQGWDLSAKFESGQQSFGNGDISSGLEGRIRKNWNNALGSVTPWLGFRGGEAIKKDDNWLYYALEGGLKFPVAGALSADVGYRYRNATEQWRNFETHRGHLTLNYALTKVDSVGVRFARSYGDDEKDAWRLSYTRSF